MTLDSKLLEIVVCPRCKGRLEEGADQASLLCPNCALSFPVKEGIPMLLDDEARDLESKQG